MTAVGSAGDAADPFAFVVFADYICPWSYAMIDVVDRAAEGYGLEPMWRPHLLHPEIPPEGADYPDPVRLEANMAWFEETAPEAAGRMTFPSRVRYSFRAFQVTEYARDRGLADPFRRAVFEALWTQDRDIGDVAVLQELADAVGLDAEEAGRVVRDVGYFERTLAAINQAGRIGIDATPTLILGTIRLNGWHYFEVVQSVLERQGREPVGQASR